MKKLQTVVFAIASAMLFASCQSNSGQTKGLSNDGTRKEIMTTIANDSIMSKEMIGTMMNSKNGMMMQQQLMGNQNTMTQLMKDNPAMRQNMLSAMMETAKSDTTMMSGMIQTMMENPQMMKMMQNRTGNKMMNGMNMGGMDNNNH